MFLRAKCDANKVSGMAFRGFLSTLTSCSELEIDLAKEKLSSQSLAAYREIDFYDPLIFIALW